MKRYRYILNGRVQGVGFRYRSQIAANKYNLTGSVKNRDDESVELIVQGDDIKIKNFLEDLKNQRFIKINGISKEELDLVDESKFIIKY